jgi:hypothetical protein
VPDATPRVGWSVLPYPPPSSLSLENSDVASPILDASSQSSRRSRRRSKHAADRPTDTRVT